MARGDPAMPLEQLVPYYQGARFALLALKMRHPDDALLTADVDRYTAMVQRFETAVIATYRLHRRRRDPSALTSLSTRLRPEGNAPPTSSLGRGRRAAVGD